MLHTGQGSLPYYLSLREGFLPPRAAWSRRGADRPGLLCAPVLARRPFRAHRRWRPDPHRPGRRPHLARGRGHPALRRHPSHVRSSHPRPPPQLARRCRLRPRRCRLRLGGSRPALAADRRQPPARSRRGRRPPRATTPSAPGTSLSPASPPSPAFLRSPAPGACGSREAGLVAPGEASCPLGHPPASPVPGSSSANCTTPPFHRRSGAPRGSRSPSAASTRASPSSALSERGRLPRACTPSPASSSAGTPAIPPAGPLAWSSKSRVTSATTFAASSRLPAGPATTSNSAWTDAGSGTRSTPTSTAIPSPTPSRPSSTSSSGGRRSPSGSRRPPTSSAGSSNFTAPYPPTGAPSRTYIAVRLIRSSSPAASPRPVPSPAPPPPSSSSSTTNSG